MSEDEKAQQIRRLVQQRDEAKRELAHLEVKIETISSVYSEVGKVLSYLRRDAIPSFTIENGRFEILHSSFVNRDIRGSLLNEGQLIEVLGEYSKVKERVYWLESQLAKLVA
ncbi:MAG: hypothetical protein WBQ76_14155 [Candidatus Korobacteraceae bacterium]